MICCRTCSGFSVVLHISLENVTLCRMNALEIPLADESGDAV